MPKVTSLSNNAWKALLTPVVAISGAIGVGRSRNDVRKANSESCKQNEKNTNALRHGYLHFQSKDPGILSRGQCRRNNRDPTATQGVNVTTM